MTTHVPRHLYVCVVTLRDFGLHRDEISPRPTPVQASSACAALELGMTQVATGPTGGGDDAVLQDGVEVGGCTSAGLPGRERLHGGEDQGQAVCYVLVWGTGQSGRVACRESTGKDLSYGVLQKHFLVAQKLNYYCLPSSSTAMTAAPLLSNTCTTVARPFLAAM